MLQGDSSGTPDATGAIGATATANGADLLALGFNVSEVVHYYGDICQAVTALAVDLRAPITAEEFQTLNGCLDVAIAEAVTEHAKRTAQSRSAAQDGERSQTLHAAQNAIDMALHAFEALKGGHVAINGSTAAVVSRNLAEVRDLVESMLAPSADSSQVVN
jgi:hypothetical protein